MSMLGVRNRLLVTGKGAIRWLLSEPDGSGRGRSTLGVLALTALLLAFGVAASPRGSRALASPGTCGAYDNPHNMYYKSPDRGGVHGVTAAVTVRSSGLCSGTTTGNFANSYTMVYCGEYSGPDVCANYYGWAQSGFIKWLVNPKYSQDDDITVTFSQIWNAPKDDPNPDQITVYGQRHLLAGDTYHYKSQYVINGCRNDNDQPYSCLLTYVDSTVISASDFNPTTDWPQSTMGFEFAQEAGHAQTDVPGLSTSPVAFSGMQYLTQTGTWTPTDNDLLVYRNDSPTRWGRSPVSDDHKDLFTANP